MRKSKAVQGVLYCHIYLLELSASLTFAYKTTTSDGSSFMHSTPSRMILNGFPPINLLQKETKGTRKLTAKRHTIKSEKEHNYSK